MKLGIVADIHEAVAGLRQALDLLREAGADRIVVLGDLFEMGLHIRETVDLLAEARAVGVWGNHELGLCHDSSERIRQRYAGPVLDFMSTLQPRLELAGCLFSHGLPCWDATDPAIYYLGNRPETDAGRAESFQASPCRVSFVGHFHRWLIATSQSVLDWKGEEAILLHPDQRYLVVVAAVCDGWCALFDTDDNRLLPLRFRSSLPTNAAEPD
jgi:hypothetical protein